MTIHIRELGDWTTRLGDLVRAHDKKAPAEPLNIEVMVDGSYGNHMINLESPEYEVFLLISGGIGITPNQSLYNNLISQVESGRVLRKVFFIWSVKDKALVNTMTPDMLESKKLTPDYTPLSFQPGMMGVSDKSLHAPVTAANKTQPDSYQGSAVKEFDNATVTTSTDAPLPSSVVFENRFYLTRVRSEEEFTRANIDPVTQPWLKFGRPDIAALFEEVHTLLLKDNKTSVASAATTRATTTPRVAVSVCGPPGMVAAVQDLCRLTQFRGSKVRFDCHAEVFDM